MTCTQFNSCINTCRVTCPHSAGPSVGRGCPGLSGHLSTSFRADKEGSVGFHSPDNPHLIMFSYFPTGYPHASQCHLSICLSLAVMPSLQYLADAKPLLYFSHCLNLTPPSPLLLPCCWQWAEAGTGRRKGREGRDIV